MAANVSKLNGAGRMLRARDIVYGRLLPSFFEPRWASAAATPTAAPAAVAAITAAASMARGNVRDMLRRLPARASSLILMVGGLGGEEE